jgi:hypothetical protein
VHRLSELVADLPRALALRAVEQPLQFALASASVDGGTSTGRVRERPLGRVPARRACRT